MNELLDTPLWLVVPAGGRGERMGAALPKQYMLLQGQTVLQHTLTRLLQIPGVAGMAVAIADTDTHWPSLPVADHALVHRVRGGASRAQSVISGLQCVLDHGGAEHWVMVHDAARPLVAISDIQRLLGAVYNSGAVGGLLAVPVPDTLKKADDDYHVAQTVDRAALWQAQTPQLFRAGALYQALTQAPDPEGITDEASAMEQAGHEPLLVEALQPNIKMTRPVDMLLAEAWLNTPESSSAHAWGVV